MGARVAVAGASGYAGGELLRLIAGHPDLDLAVAAAHTSAGTDVTALHPQLRSLAGLTFADTSAITGGGADLVFLALPAGPAARVAAQLPESVKVVDLGADHRLRDPAAHARHYDGTADPWVYGLPELPGARREISAASRVANTGCHAAAAILPLAPLIAAGVVESADVVVTSISGTSGAGRTAAPHLLGSEVMGDVCAYKVGAHRHVPEIEQASGAVGLAMIPVLAPMPRGILSCIAARPRGGATALDARNALVGAYGDEPFVHVLPAGMQPHTAATLGSAAAHLQVEADAASGRLLLTCALDNLGKGAAAQAVQNANLMLGLPETAGLTADGLAP